MEDRDANMIGKRARAARVARGWSQAHVAERMEISLEFYGRLERGVALPSIGTLVRLAEVLETRPDVLLGFDAGPAPRRPAVSPARSPADADSVLARRLRRASPAVLRLVRELLGAFERAEGRSRRVERP